VTVWTGTQSPKWLRTCQLLVGKDGDGNVSPSSGLLIDSSLTPEARKAGSTAGIRIVFEITKTVYRTPNVSTIKVYNLNQTHENMVMGEFNDVILKGGYQGSSRLFFRGNIKYANAFRDGNDRVIELNCGDGDKDFHGALINFTLSAGHSDADAIKQLMTSMRATTLGHVAGKNLFKKHSRGRAFSGSARDILDRIADNNDAQWSIQDGILIMVPVDSTLPNKAIAVSSETGLKSAPEVNDKGIGMKLMFDPRIVPGSKLWLLNNEVKMKHLKAQLTGQKRKLHGPNRPVRTDPDGIYKVYAVHITGDTRGPDWDSEVKCVALDSPIPSIKGLPQSSTPDSDILP
jgi:hypothetical protein